MSRRGDVAIRFSVRDREQFRRQMESIGPEAEKTFERMMRAARPVDARLGAVDGAVRQLKTSVTGMARQSGPAGAFLTTLGGPLALGAAAALGLIAVAVREVFQLMERSREVAQYASNLETVSVAAGMSITDVQNLGTAVELAGGQFDAGTAALEEFSKRLGRVRALGQGEAFDALKTLGIGPQDLAGMSADQALERVLDRLMQIDDVSQRLALADRLGLAGMDELLRQTASTVRDLRADAEGFNAALSEETMQRLASAAQEMDALRMRRQTAERVEAAAFTELELRRQRAETAVAEARAARAADRIPLEERSVAILEMQRDVTRERLDQVRRMVESGFLQEEQLTTQERLLRRLEEREAALTAQMERRAQLDREMAVRQATRAASAEHLAGVMGLDSGSTTPELPLQRRRQLESLVESSLRSLMTPTQQLAELERDLNLARAAGMDITEAQIAAIVQRRRDEMGLNEVLNRRTELEAVVKSSLEQLITPTERLAALEANLREAQARGLPITDAQIEAVLRLGRAREGLLTDEERRQALLESLIAPTVALEERLADLYALLEEAPQHAETIKRALAAVHDSINGAGADAVAVGGDTRFGGLRKMAEHAQDLEAQVDRAVTGGLHDLDNMLDRLRRGSLSTGEAFMEMGDMIVSTLMRMATQRFIIGPLADVLFGAVSGVFGGGVPAKGAPVKAGVRHAGGMIDGTGPFRSVPASLADNAPRYHTGGGLGRDEHLIIGRDGERVLNPSENSALFSLLDRLSGSLEHLGGGRDEKLEIVLRDQSGGRIQARERRGGGGRSLELMLREQVSNLIGEGAFDAPMGERYGQRVGAYER